MGRESLSLKFEPTLHSTNKWLHCALYVGSCRSREFLTASQFLIFTMNFVITNSKKSKKNLTRLPLRKVQFSCWTHSNPNRPKIVHEKLIIYIFNPNAYTLKIKLKEHIIDSALVSNPCLMLQIIIIFNSVCLDLLKTFMHCFILFKYACIVSYYTKIFIHCFILYKNIHALFYIIQIFRFLISLKAKLLNEFIRPFLVLICYYSQTDSLQFFLLFAIYLSNNGDKTFFE